jgi:Family of unknown function (DUF5681)
MTESSTTNDGTGDAGVEHQRGDYRVGYGRPPVEHRFKTGNRANPKGRGKRTRNRRVVLREVLFELIKISEGGVEKQMPALQVVLKGLLSQALKGELKALITVIGMAQREGLLTPEQEEAVEALPDNDRAILLDGMQRFNQATDAVLKAGASSAEASLSHEN